jgi:hypothetical protein
VRGLAINDVIMIHAIRCSNLRKIFIAQKFRVGTTSTISIDRRNVEINLTGLSMFAVTVYDLHNTICTNDLNIIVLSEGRLNEITELNLN